MKSAPAATAACTASPPNLSTVTFGMPGEAGGRQLDTLVGREQAGRLVEVVEHADDDVAEQLHRLLDDVDVPEMERVEAAGDQHRCHVCSKR